jgi:tetratricopeptide (TPR) repeat protein
MEETIMISKEASGLGWDDWLSKRSEETLGIKKGERFDHIQPMDNLTKMRWIMAIDQRFMLTMHKNRLGSVNEQVIKDLKEIYTDYEQLLQSGPNYCSLYTEETLREKIAYVLSKIAVAYESTRDYLTASQYLEEAIQCYNKIGKAEQIERCQADLARIRFDVECDLDDEIQRLYNLLETLPKETVGHVQALIDLSNLYSNNGDNYEAKDLLVQAELELKAINNDPDGKTIAEAFENSLLGLYSDRGRTPEKMSIETALELNALYRLLYLSLARVYEAEDPQEAAKYYEEAAKRDSRKYNDEFSNSMLQALVGELGNLL